MPARSLSRRRLPALGLVLVLAVAVLAVVLATRTTGAGTGTGGCAAWSAALSAKQQRDASLVGADTARQFRREAEQSGWLDEGGRLRQRPQGCA